MLFESFCGINVNLIKASVVVGVLEIFSIMFEIFNDLQFYKECKLRNVV